MIVIFDLDDTLYDESTYVESGLIAVAEFGGSSFGLPAAESLKMLKSILAEEGRGQVFDLWLKSNGMTGRGLVQECVNVYRHHTPRLTLTPEAASVLEILEGQVPLYLVTDGHKVAQARKVAALGLERRFDRILLTHRFGRLNAKPSTYCFELIRGTERCSWGRMVYIGDNPAKDFVGLNRVGMPTVRVLTGRHRNDIAPAGHEALHRISSLKELLPLLELLDASTEA